MIYGQPVSFGGDPVAEQATPSISVSSAGLITASATQTAGYVAAGTKSATKQLTVQAAKTITPTTSDQTAVAKNRYTTGAVTVKGDANLKAANIVKGVSIFGVAGSALPMKLLWTNASPTSAFAAQTVALSGANYSGYIIEMRYSTTNDTTYRCYREFDENNILGINKWNSSPSTSRSATVTSSGISFGSYAGGSNTYLIPTRIWGVKVG